VKGADIWSANEASTSSPRRHERRALEPPASVEAATQRATSRLRARGSRRSVVAATDYMRRVCGAGAEPGFRVAMVVLGHRRFRPQRLPREAAAFLRGQIAITSRSRRSRRSPTTASSSLTCRPGDRKYKTRPRASGSLGRSEARYGSQRILSGTNRRPQQGEIPWQQ
jgi:hypothetical protein